MDRRFMPFGRAYRALSLCALIVLATGCGTGERICGSDQYPAKAVGNTTGRVCVPNGRQPPSGYVRYPEGKVPQHIGDEWDRYWGSVVVDDKGTIVSEAPQAPPGY